MTYKVVRNNDTIKSKYLHNCKQIARNFVGL